MSKNNYGNKDIDNILYSAIRNKRHFQVRRWGYTKNIFISLKTFFTSSNTNFKKEGVKNGVLSDLSDSHIDLDLLKPYGYNTNVKAENRKSFALIEFYLSLAFVIKITFFQKLVFKILDKKVTNLIANTNLNVILCGHPTLTITFISNYLKRSALPCKIITVQHGIYNLKKYKVLWFEKEIATHIVVYGEYFKDLYANQGVPKDRILIGNPYFSSKFQEQEKIDLNSNHFVNKKILFLGQQFYKVSSVSREPYNSIITQLMEFYKNKDCEFYYKPHPREEITKSLSKNNMSEIKLFAGSPTSDSYLNNFDVFYSVNSTLLLETYLKKKICYQVDLHNSTIDYFKDYSGIPLVETNNVKNHLKKDFYEFYIDTEYLKLESNPPRALLNLVKEILSNRYDNE